MKNIYTSGVDPLSDSAFLHADLPAAHGLLASKPTGLHTLTLGYPEIKRSRPRAGGLPNRSRYLFMTDQWLLVE
jgi:hypothetical protein